MATKPEIAAMYKFLAENYPHHELAYVSVYEAILLDLPGGALRAAALDYIREGNPFPPTPGQIARRVFELFDQAEGRISPPEAWELVVREITRVGHPGKPELPDLVWRAIQNIGGWRNLCLSQNQISDRARFLEAYKILDLREQRERRMHPEVREQIRLLSARMSAGKLVAGIQPRSVSIPVTLSKESS